MHMVSVVFQLVFPLKCCITVLTVERPGIRMNNQVFCQGFLNSKRLIANLTFVWFFTCMNKNEMKYKMHSLGKTMIFSDRFSI